jgi:hypothetical protein
MGWPATDNLRERSDHSRFRSAKPSAKSDFIALAYCRYLSEEGPMDERLRNWHPTKREVDAIIREVRPLIRDLARRDQEAIAAEIYRRKAAQPPT